MAVLAVIFDFDDTLVPDSTSALLAAHGLDPTDFWSNRVKAQVDAGYDPPLAYLNLLLEEVGDGKAFGRLTNDKLKEFGRSLDNSWFPGLPGLFEDLRAIANEHRDVSIEYYIISGGLQTIIEGSAYVEKHVTGVYGCQLGEDPKTGTIRYIKRCVTFTEKTRFLYEINKGIPPAEAATKPHLVNEMVDERDRPIPFENMIYVGDGLTDIPCFSLLSKNQGTTFGVFKRDGESAKQAFQSFLATRRVQTMHFPDYRDDAELGSLLRAAVATACSRIMLRSARPV